jgi:hypothetical protein
MTVATQAAEPSAATRAIIEAPWLASRSVKHCFGAAASDRRLDQGARPEPIGARAPTPVPSGVILKPPPGGHCWILMPESLTTLAQCASCDLYMASYSAIVPPAGSAPILAKASRTFVATSALLTA